MYKLKFTDRLCLECDSCACLVRCRYLDLDFNAARREIRNLLQGDDSPVLRDCVTCYACEEYCPHGNHPFYLIVERQEERGILPAPKALIEHQMELFNPRGEPVVEPVKDTVISLCLFPKLRERLQGYFFDDATILVGRHFFCHLVFLHYAKNSVIRERLPHTLESLARHGIKELVCFHDECYGLFQSYAPAYGYRVPFRAVHMFEYLYRKLEEVKEKIRPLNLKVAYQRPCSSRLTPGKERYLDRIFNLIGVERVERKYDRENALCCAAVIMTQGREELAGELQRLNIDDMVEHGASACVFNCAFCYMTLKDPVSQRGLRPLLITDLCRLALEESLPGGE